VLHVYRSVLAQTFWTAIVAWTTCFVVTIIVSLLTRPRPESELGGLVYSLTPKPKDKDLPWIKRPASLAMIVVVLIVGLNLIFL
jgi:SSS family solute:Na+ symporter